MLHFKNLLTVDLDKELALNKGKVILKSPREHQVSAHKNMSKFFLKDEENAGILVLPTGGGKTYTAVYWLLKNIISKNKKILWIADQGQLLEQARDAFFENILEVDTRVRHKINIRLVSGSDRHANPNSISVSDDILLITSQTAISNWNDNKDTKFKKFIHENAKDGNLFIVYDEAHHTPAYARRNLLIGGSEGMHGIIELYPKTQLLGLTATPTYTAKNQRGWLWEIFNGGIIYEVSKKELEDKKILATPAFIQEKTDFKPLLSDTEVDNIIFKHQEIPSYIIDEIAQNEERNSFVAQYYCDNKEKFGKTIIFLDRWYQCKMVESYINKKAGKTIAASIFSFVDTNKNIDYINNRSHNQNDENLEKFKNNELDVLINVKMLTEGVDVPDVKTVFITRETNSNILFTQMVGRALRGEGAGGNKSTAYIVMFTDNWNRHIQFANNRYFGGKDDSSIQERGYRPHELIRIDLLDKLELEYQNMEYDRSVFDLIPIGWYVVSYVDTIEEDDDDTGEIQKITGNFNENVIVMEQEQAIFKHFINNFNDFYKNYIWEQEELYLEAAENLIKEFLEKLDQIPNKALISKLIQIARHLGQNNTEPEYYTFEQKNDINLMKYVRHIRNENYGRDEAEGYLENEYSRNDNPFLKVIFPTYEDFYRAYEYEDNVYRKRKKGITSITEAEQSVKVKSLASDEVRRIVLSRDGYRCQCCGKTTNLQIDHIVAFKETEPDDDNPELYQTLCGTCNQVKSSNSYNYRFTNYVENRMSIENVLVSKDEEPEFYFTRLINCFYKTKAVQPGTVHAKDHHTSVWKAEIKYGADPLTTILRYKKELINIIKQKGYHLKDIEISSK